MTQGADQKLACIQGKLRFEVKWEGFEKKSDRTWEPLENLQGSADEILDEYLQEHGTVAELYESFSKATKTKKRGRPSAGATPGSTKKSRKNGDHPLDSEPPESRKAVAWKPPSGSWEDQIDTVDMTRNDKGELIVWLGWKNGEKSQHKAQQAYTRAPQKVSFSDCHAGSIHGLVDISCPPNLLTSLRIHRCSNFTNPRSTLQVHRTCNSFALGKKSILL